jgi:tetratricopeptide (TPR) repeat protein
LNTLHPAPYTLAVCWLVASCSPIADHERLGDRRYSEHAYVDALAEYRLAMHKQQSPGYELRAKFAQAALHAGALGEAVVAYHDLAHAEPASLDEAADGLTRAARMAMGAHDMSALADALAALRDITPQRPVGALAVALGAGASNLDKHPEAMDVLLEAAAAAPSAASADSFLVAYAVVNGRLGRCDAATGTYEAVLRRRAVPPLVRAARGGLAGCAIEDGKVSLSTGALQEAEARFRKAISIGEPDSVVRLAWLLIGDARWAGGDTSVALDAYRRAGSGAPDGDPIAARATEQINRLLGKGTGTP